MDFAALKTRFQNPDFQDRLGGIGQALAGLDQGRVADLSGVRDSIRQRTQAEELRDSLSDPALLSRFTPEQRQMLANMPPQAAQALIAETIFKEPDPAIAFREQLQASGVLDRFTPEQQVVLMSLPPDQAQQVISSTVFAPAPAPVAGVNVGGTLVNPIDGTVIYQGAPDPSHRVLTAPEVAQLGLPEGAYQQAPDGKITSIGGGGQNITINTGDESSQFGDAPTGTVFVYDETGAHVMEPAPGGGQRPRVVPLAGTEAEGRVVEQVEGADKGSAQADSMLATIDGLLADPGLDSAVGTTGAITQYMGPLAPDAARARSRIQQIQGQAFLQAFESLKGGGQITEIEGQKAEAAIARLNTAQSADDFRAALLELKGVIERANGGGQSPAATTDMSDDDLLNLYLGGN